MITATLDLSDPAAFVQSYMARHPGQLVQGRGLSPAEIAQVVKDRRTQEHRRRHPLRTGTLLGVLADFASIITVTAALERVQKTVPAVTRPSVQSLMSLYTRNGWLVRTNPCEYIATYRRTARFPKVKQPRNEGTK